MKVQMSLNDELVQRLGKYAKENYLSRSAVMSIAVNQYLNLADKESKLNKKGGSNSFPCNYTK